MYTSTEHGDWDSIYSLLDYLEVAFEAVAAHADTALEIDSRVSKLVREEGGEGFSGSHVRHLRNVQPMKRRVAEGVLAYGDLLEYTRTRLRGELVDEEETATEVGKHVHEAIHALKVDNSETAREHLVEALKVLRGMRGADAGLELAGVPRIERVAS